MHDDFVPSLKFEPHHCAFTLRNEDPDGFFQGRNLTGPADVAAISVSRVRTYAESLGFVHPDDHQHLLDSHMRALALMEEQDAEIQRLKDQFEAIDVLASAGFQARKKPGRPAIPNKEKVA